MFIIDEIIESITTLQPVIASVAVAGKGTASLFMVFRVDRMKTVITYRVHQKNAAGDIKTKFVSANELHVALDLFNKFVAEIEK